MLAFILSDVSLIVMVQFESFDMTVVYWLYWEQLNVITLLSPTILVISELVNDAMLAFIVSDVSLIVMVWGVLIKLLTELYWEHVNVIEPFVLTILVINELVKEAIIAAFIFSDVSLIVMVQFDSFDINVVYWEQLNVITLPLPTILVINELVNDAIAAVIFDDVSLIVNV